MRTLGHRILACSFQILESQLTSSSCSRKARLEASLAPLTVDRSFRSCASWSHSCLWEALVWSFSCLLESCPSRTAQLSAGRSCLACTAKCDPRSNCTDQISSAVWFFQNASTLSLPRFRVRWDTSNRCRSSQDLESCVHGTSASPPGRSSGPRTSWCTLSRSAAALGSKSSLRIWKAAGRTRCFAAQCRNGQSRGTGQCSWRISWGHRWPLSSWKCFALTAVGANPMSLWIRFQCRTSPWSSHCELEAPQSCLWWKTYSRGWRQHRRTRPSSCRIS